MRRRGWLTLGWTGAAVPALGGGAIARLRTGVSGGILSALGRQVFAAGARAVTPGHEAARPLVSRPQAGAALATLPMQPRLVRVGSAHVMGGCGMAACPRDAVGRPDGVHWQLANLPVHDGSIFPPSVGVNPQLSVHGLVHRLAQELARHLTGRQVPLA